MELYGHDDRQYSALKGTVQCGISGIWIGLRISALTNKKSRLFDLTNKIKQAITSKVLF